MKKIITEKIIYMAMKIEIRILEPLLVVFLFLVL